MKVAFIITLLLLNITLGVILLLTTPHGWPITSGSIKIKKLEIDGQPFLKIDGEPMNYLGQIQTITFDFDDSGKRIVITRCKITMNPFSRIVVNNQWPVLYPLADVKPGKYSVVYKTTKGEETAGSFDVP